MNVSSASARPTRGALLFKAGVGLFLMAAGMVTAALLFVPYEKAMRTRAWAEVPCRITESRIETREPDRFARPEYRLILRYRYFFNGSEYIGARLRLGSFFSADDREVAKKSPHAEELRKIAKRYPAGAEATCRVNPDAPGEAVLEHHSPAALYTIWWPLLFAAGGAGMVWSVVRQWRRRAV